MNICETIFSNQMDASIRWAPFFSILLLSILLIDDGHVYLFVIDPVFMTSRLLLYSNIDTNFNLALSWIAIIYLWLNLSGKFSSIASQSYFIMDRISIIRGCLLSFEVAMHSIQKLYSRYLFLVLCKKHIPRDICNDCIAFVKPQRRCSDGELNGTK